MYKHTKRNLPTCSWLVCRLGLEGFHVSGAGGLKGRGGGAEGGFWLLPASRPSPIAAVGCSGWADSVGRFDLAGAGGTGGSPLRPLHSSLDSLKGRLTKSIITDSAAVTIIMLVSEANSYVSGYTSQHNYNTSNLKLIQYLHTPR